MTGPALSVGPVWVGSPSPAGPDAAVQPRWSLSRRLPRRATAVTGFGSPRRWRRTSSSEVERPLAKKRCGGLLSAAVATPQRSSSDSSQSEAVVASGISTDSSWPGAPVRIRARKLIFGVQPQKAKRRQHRHAGRAPSLGVDDRTACPPDALIRSRSVRRSPRHHPPRCRGTSRSTPAWSAQAVGRPNPSHSEDNLGRSSGVNIGRRVTPLEGDRQAGRC